MLPGSERSGLQGREHHWALLVGFKSLVSPQNTLNLQEQHADKISIILAAVGVEAWEGRSGSMRAGALTWGLGLLMCVCVCLVCGGES